MKTSLLLAIATVCAVTAPVTQSAPTYLSKRSEPAHTETTTTDDHATTDSHATTDEPTSHAQAAETETHVEATDDHTVEGASVDAHAAAATNTTDPERCGPTVAGIKFLNVGVQVAPLKKLSHTHNEYSLDCAKVVEVAQDTSAHLYNYAVAPGKTFQAANIQKTVLVNIPEHKLYEFSLENPGSHRLKLGFQATVTSRPINANSTRSCPPFQLKASMGNTTYTDDIMHHDDSTKRCHIMSSVGNYYPVSCLTREEQEKIAAEAALHANEESASHESTTAESSGHGEEADSHSSSSSAHKKKKRSLKKRCTPRVVVKKRKVVKKRSVAPKSSRKVKRQFPADSEDTQPQSWEDFLNAGRIDLGVDTEFAEELNDMSVSKSVTDLAAAPRHRKPAQDLQASPHNYVSIGVQPHEDMEVQENAGDAMGVEYEGHADMDFVESADAHEEEASHGDDGHTEGSGEHEEEHHEEEYTETEYDCKYIDAEKPADMCPALNPRFENDEAVEYTAEQAAGEAAASGGAEASASHGGGHLITRRRLLRRSTETAHDTASTDDHATTTDEHATTTDDHSTTDAHATTDDHSTTDAHGSTDAHAEEEEVEYNPEEHDETKVLVEFPFHFHNATAPFLLEAIPMDVDSHCIYYTAINADYVKLNLEEGDTRVIASGSGEGHSAGQAMAPVSWTEMAVLMLAALPIFA